MAEEHNALKYGSPISKGAAAALGGGYGEVGISRMSETLQPVANLWQVPEWAYLRNEYLFATRVSSPAVALRFSGIELVNPLGSQVIAVLEGVHLDSASTLAVDLQMDTGAALGTTATTRGLGRDGRLFTRNTPNVTLSRLTVVTGDFAAGANTPQDRLLDISPSFPQIPALGPWVITPGTKLFLLAAIAANVVAAALFWRERQAFPGELINGG
jgi:hypothetical protein